MYKLLIVGFFCSILFTPTYAQQAHDSVHQIKVVAHRGAKKFAPENTLAAFKKAYEMGADYCEMDVRMTKDSVLIIMHDSKVDRTTNGSGKVSEMTLEEIKALDAGSWFGPAYVGEKVPTLREVLQQMKDKIIPDIDFKAGDPTLVIHLLQNEGYLEEAEVTFHSGNRKILNKVLELTDKVLIRPSSKGGLTNFAEMRQELQPTIVNVNWGEFSPQYINAIHGYGINAFVNCLRRADKKKCMKKAIAANADYIQADNLDILIPMVKQHNSAASTAPK